MTQAPDACRTSPVRISLGASVVWAALAALLNSLIWPPVGWWWLSFVAIAPLAIVAIGQPTAKRAFLLVFLSQCIPWAIVEWWMVQLTPLGMPFLVAYCAAWVAAWAVVVRWVCQSAIARRVPMTLLVPILWTGIEYLRSTLVLGGYPWYQLGIGLVGDGDSSGWMSLSASLLGGTLLSSVAAMVSGVLVDWWLVWRGGREAACRTRALVWSGVTALALAAHIGVSVWIAGTPQRADSMTVLVVQTDLSASNKNAWTREEQERDVATYLRVTLQAAMDAQANGVGVDLVAWPETMIPGFGLEIETIRTLVDGGYYPGSIYADALAALHERIERPIVVGSATYLGLRADTATETWKFDQHFNSAYLINGPRPWLRYDKLVLTPFGEEMPLISRFDWLEQQLLALGAPGMTFDLLPGERLVRFAVPLSRGGSGGGTLRFVTPICFEDTVAGVCRDLVYENGERVADLMLNLSNDGWFGTSDAGRAHHALHARMRAIELGTPMIRCANTGLSVAIEWNGRVSDEIRPIGAGVGTMAKPMTVGRTERSTLYGRIGDVWPWSMLCLTIAALVVCAVDRRRTRTRSVETVVRDGV